MPTASKSSPKSWSEKVRTMLVLAANVMLLFLPLWTSCLLHESDSLIVQSPSDDALEDHDGLGDIGFGIRRFGFEDILNSTNSAYDVPFSEEQEDALGNNHHASKILYFILNGFMWLSLVGVVMLYFYRRFYVKEDNLLNAAKLGRSLARGIIPWLLLLSLLMLIPFYLLTRSNLCTSSSYMELGFVEEEDSDSSSSSDSSDDCDDGDWVGTYVLLVDDVPSTCEIGCTGNFFLVTRAVVPFLLVLQARYLLRKSDALESQYHQLQAAQDPTSTLKDIEEDAQTVTSETADDP